MTAASDSSTTPIVALPRRQVAGVTLARTALLGGWFVATVIIGRVLGPAAVGLFGLCQAAIQLMTDCVSDPLDAAVMREAPLHFRSGDRAAALAVIRNAFWLRGGLGVVGLGVTAAVPWLIARLVFNSPDYQRLALLTAAGILGDLLLRSALGYLQVSERFGRLLVVDGIWQLARAVAAIALAASHRLDAMTAVELYVAAPYLAFVIGVWLIPADVRTPAAPHPQHIAGIIRFSKWLAAALILVAIYERVDMFLLNYFHGSAAVGFYWAALSLAMVPDRLNGIVQTAITPRIAPAHAGGQFRGLQRQYLAFLPLGIAATIIGWLLAGPIVRLLLGHQFEGAILPLRILLVGTMFNLCVMPLAVALLNFVSPERAALAAGAGLVVVLGGALALIPPLGAVGAAWSILLARLAVGGITLVFVQRITGREGVGETPAAQPPPPPSR